MNIKAMRKGIMFSKLLIFAIVLFSVGYSLPAQGTFTETRTLNCGDTAWVSGLGYPTWNDPHIIVPPRWGFAKLYGDFVPPNLLIYESPKYFTGTDTVIIECAHATQITCDTGIYVFEIECDSAVTGDVYTYQVPCNDTLYAGNLSGWSNPQIIAGPEHGSARIILEPADGAGVEYAPAPDFEGLDFVVVHHFDDTLLYLFQVSCQATQTGTPPAVALLLYPNPADETVWVKGPETIREITISDASGRIYFANFSKWAGRYRLDVSGLPAGVYTVCFRDDDTVFIGRLVKVR